MSTQNKYTAVITQEDGWYLGWVEEVPGANAQEKSRHELMISLREAVQDILEIHRQKARQQAKSDYEEVALFV